jgi:MFS family permease
MTARTDPSDPLDSGYSWARLGLSLLAATVGNVGMWSIVVILPAVQAEFETGRGGASMPFTLTMLGFALGNLLIGRAVDRHGVAPVLAVAGLTSGAGFAMAALSPSIVVLALAQFVIGLGAAATFGPLIADVSLWFRRRRGIAVGIIASGNYLSGAIWPLLLAGVLETQGWRAVCWVLAAIVAGAMLPMALTLRRRLPAEWLAPAAQATRHRLETPFSPRTLTWLLALAGVACCVAMAMPQVHLVALCVDLGYGPAVGAEMLALMLMGGVVSRLVSGLIADRLGGIRTLLIGSVLQMLALALYLPAGGMTSLYIVSLIFGLSQGGIVPAYALIVRETMPAKEAGARVGTVIMATILGMALGGWMSGAVYDWTGSYTLAFVNGIAWNLLNVLIVVGILLSARRRGGRVPASA